jgi:hypothetical protein
MRSFEIGSANPESNHQQLPELGEVANKIQIKLAQTLFSKKHPDIVIEDRAARNQIMIEWGQGYARKFRAYVEDSAHVHERVDPDNREDIEHLLGEIEKYEQESTH